MTLAGSSGILSLHCCIRCSPQGRGDDTLEGTGCHRVDTGNHRHQVTVIKAGDCYKYQLPPFTVSSRDQRDGVCWNLGLCQSKGLLQPEPLLILCKT